MVCFFCFKYGGTRKVLFSPENLLLLRVKGNGLSKMKTTPRLTMMSTLS